MSTEQQVINKLKYSKEKLKDMRLQLLYSEGFDPRSGIALKHHTITLVIPLEKWMLLGPNFENLAMEDYAEEVLDLVPDQEIIDYFDGE